MASRSDNYRKYLDVYIYFLPDYEASVRNRMPDTRILCILVILGKF